jgi:hypothetical protein
MAKKTKRQRRRSYEQRIEDEQAAAQQEITARVQREQRARELERLRVAAAQLSMDDLARLARYTEFILAHDRADNARAGSVSEAAIAAMAKVLSASS